ncbi:MAG TPA: AraC family transcriptional regulator ligand-binding domain-containing protein, partial [Dokdonella sp.]|nr:AraC family transcriptional regulator ligand-binding domain-containing protein [Dokdonella sp.]
MRKRARPAFVPGPNADVSARYAEAFLDFATTLRPSSWNAAIPVARIEGPRVDGARFCEWVSRAARATSDEDIGFRFGARVAWRAFGLLGIAAAAAPTLGEALGRVVRRQPLVDTLGTLRISHRGRLLHLQWRP